MEICSLPRYDYEFDGIPEINILQKPTPMYKSHPQL